MTARQPRALIRLGGTVVPGWFSWSVSTNSYFEADTFRIEYAIQSLPVAKNANWFSTQTELFAEILAGFPQDPGNPQPAELTSAIYGRVDDIEFRPREGTLCLTGRDLTAAFIDAKVSKEYPNKTSSDIATQLAQSHGLASQVTATTTKVGAYYTRDQVRMTADRSEWDLLAWLAREENFVCFVSGQTLYFEPDPRSTANPYLIQWQAATSSQGSPIANVKGITFARSLTVAKGITVTARSASLTQKTAVVQSYPSSPKSIGVGKSSPFGASQQYFFTLPAGKKPTEVQAYAKQRYDDIVSHEMKLTMHLPSDDALTIATAIKVSGTGTAFDQTYYPRLITREMSMDEGYNMTVEAQNSSSDISPAS